MPSLPKTIQYSPRASLDKLPDISHTILEDIGTNTHAQIDTHIADSSVHYALPAPTGLAAGGTWKTLYNDGSGNVTELALGTATHVLTSNGPSSAPSWQAAGGGGASAMDDLSDVTLTSVGAGDMLFYDNGTAQWINTAKLNFDNSATPYLEVVTGAVALRLGGTAGTTVQALSSGANTNLYLNRAGGHTYVGNSSGMTSSGGMTCYHSSGQILFQVSGATSVIGSSSSSAGFQIINSSSANCFKITASTSAALMQLQNNGAFFRFFGPDAGGVSRFMLVMDPDNSCDLYYTGSIAMQTTSTGGATRRTTGTTTSHKLQDSSGTDEGGIFSTSSSAYLYGYNHGGVVQLWGEDTGGTGRLILQGNGDGGTAIYHAGTAIYTSASNGMTFYAANTAIRVGTGDPEGVVTSDVGSIWLRTDGGTSTSLYVKESGTGNTGWVAK